MAKQAEHVGTRLVNDIIVDVDLSDGLRRPRRFRRHLCRQNHRRVDRAQARWLGCRARRPIAASASRPVRPATASSSAAARSSSSAAAHAVEEALYLTNHATRVTLIHRRDSLRAEKILQDRLFDIPISAVVWDSTVEEIVASRTRRVTGIVCADTKSGAEHTAHGVRGRLHRHRPYAVTELFKAS